jgi:putative acetyltransferase
MRDGANISVMLVRRYEADDRDDVRWIHGEAFRRQEDPQGIPPEVGLLDALTDAGDVVGELSLVALVGGRPVGHVLGSRAGVAGHAVVALGPVGVLPAHQRQGVGSAMMHAVLAAADALDLPLVALLGATEYYRRFGFVAATTLGIEPQDPDWGEHFQVRTLTAYDSSIAGPFRYAPAFDSL